MFEIQGDHAKRNFNSKFDLNLQLGYIHEREFLKMNLIDYYYTNMEGILAQ